MTDPSDVLREFERLIAGSDPRLGPGATVEKVLECMPDASAQLLRLCAIPHHFNDRLIHVLAPEFGEDERRRYTDEFSKLSFMTLASEGWTFHDQVRRHLFGQWLQLDRSGEFSRASGRLAAHFHLRAQALQGEASATARRRGMFHRLGEQLELGWDEFEALLESAREHRMASEAHQLVQLVHEYDPALAPEWKLRLLCNEAQLLFDEGELAQAEEVYQSVLESSDATTELRAVATWHIGQVHSENRDWDAAIQHYDRALELAKTARIEQTGVATMLLDLGAAWRDKGDDERSERFLREGLALAQQVGDLPSQAKAYNLLGTLALRGRDVTAAIDAFEQSLAALRELGDVFRQAQVYNNLAAAYADKPDWERSAAFVQQSLEIKRKAQDTLGQAAALNSLARIQASRGEPNAALDSYGQALQLYLEMRRNYEAAMVQRNRGKLLRGLERRTEARRDFEAALEAFERLKKPRERDDTLAELAALDARAKGLGCVMWGAIVLFVVFVVFVALTLIGDLAK